MSWEPTGGPGSQAALRKSGLGPWALQLAASASQGIPRDAIYGDHRSPAMGVDGGPKRTADMIQNILDPTYPHKILQATYGPK